MRKRNIVLLAVAALFIFGGPATAASYKDITTQLGGKVGSLFKIAGQLFVAGNMRVDGQIFRGNKAGITDNKPVVINDKVQIKGDLTVKGLPVTGLKYYTGTFDTSADGDHIATQTNTVDCTTAPITYIKTTKVHYKSIAVPEITISQIPDVRVYWKPIYPTIIGASEYSPTYYPNGNDIWNSAGFGLTEGKVNVMYKTIYLSCTGSVINTTTITTGEYKILVRP